MAARQLDRADNFTRRPWPVNPRQYPLSGPSQGRVILPTRPLKPHVRALLLAAIWLDDHT